MIYDAESDFDNNTKKPNKPLRWGYRIAHEIGKPCRSITGHVYYREHQFTPIRRLTHKPHTVATYQKNPRRLGKRQMMRLITREAAARTIAQKFPAEKA
jgi:hypothetical protein